MGIVTLAHQDRCHRPSFVFARGADEGLFRGSAAPSWACTCATRLDLATTKREADLLARLASSADPRCAGTLLRDASIDRFDAALRQG